MGVAGLVLAAGAGVRFGTPKAPVVVDGERLVDRAIRVLTEGGCDPVVVVLGAWVGDVRGADVLVNDAWPEGMGSSLRAGLDRLTELAPDADAAVVTLVDLPGVTAEAVRRLVDCPAPLAVATFGGERGHPVRLGREWWSAARDVAQGDQGARQLLKSGDVALVEVGDVAQGYDVDVPAT